MKKILLLDNESLIEGEKTGTLSIGQTSFAMETESVNTTLLLHEQTRKVKTVQKSNLSLFRPSVIITSLFPVIIMTLLLPQT